MTSPWHAIALSRDIAPGTAAPVLLDGREIVVWRGTGGGVRVWEDRCPHRGMRLSFGFVREEELVCLYHGWRWGGDAGCTHIPAHPDLAPPKTLCATAFLAREVDGLVWMADGEPPGEPPRAPAGALPVASLFVERSVETLAARLGAEGPLATAEIDGVHLAVALQPLDTKRSFLHVLTTADDHSRAARRRALAAAEALRRDLETGDTR